MKPKKLIEVAMPIKEISAESVRDKSIRHGHISTLHLWWARRPLPVCRAVVFASLVPDPLDDNCPQAFKEAVAKLLKSPLYKPYDDIPYTSAIDCMEDNLRHRLMMFIGKFSDKCQKNMIAGKATSPAEQLADSSLIKWENKSNERVLRIARELIWVAYNAQKAPEESYNTLHHYFTKYYDAIKEHEEVLFGIRDRHIRTEEVKQAEEALRKAIQEFQSNMPSVFDPFAGGATIPLEAARLGCRSFGNDINPVAHVIEKGSAEFPQQFGKPIILSEKEFVAKYGNEGIKMAQEEEHNITFESDGYHIPNRLCFDVEYYAKKILKDTETQVGWMYPSHKGNKPIAYYWARTAKCSNPSCGAEVPLLKGFYLCNSPKRKVYLHPIVKGTNICFEIKEGTTNQKSFFTPRQCTIVCPCCGSITDVNNVKAQFKSNQSGEKLLAVIEENNVGKTYRIPTKEEFDLIDQIPKVTNRPKDKMEVKNQRNFNTPGWGIDSYGQMFSDRQLTMLYAFIESFNQCKQQLGDENYAQAVVTYLALWIDRIVTYNTMFATYEVGGEKVKGLFGRQAIPMVFDFPESNPFCGKSGSALNQLEWVLRYLSSESKEPFCATFANASSGEKTQFAEKSITAVVTDPPYYDAIAYADCSDFFYVWLKQTLGDVFPLVFSTPQTPKTEECTALKHHHNNSLEEGKRHFENKLTQIFDAIEIQTSDIVSIMFAHQSTEAWTTLCNSILDARMNITGSWPMDTEMQGALKTDKAYLESSVTVSCRPSERKGFAEYKDVKKAIEKNVHDEVNKLYDLGFRGADLLTACFGQAVSEFGKYETVEKSNGDKVTVAELLELARDTAFNALLEGVQGDNYTKFYLGWLQLNGMGETDYDDVTKFTRVGLPINIREVFEHGLLIKEDNGSKQHLATAAEHLKSDHIAGSRSEDLLIDQAHRAILYYRDENRTGLLKLLRDIDAMEANAPFWRLLASLKELLPANDDLKQVQGLLLNGEDLRQASRQNEQPTVTQTSLEL